VVGILGDHSDCEARSQFSGGFHPTCSGWNNVYSHTPIAPKAAMLSRVSGEIARGVCVPTLHLGDPGTSSEICGEVVVYLPTLPIRKNILERRE